MPSDGPSTFSSQLSQLFHGVTPPAQLRIVPTRLRYCFSTVSVSGSSSSVVVPPGSAASPIRSNASADAGVPAARSEEHTSELQSLMRISYAVFCLKKKQQQKTSITAQNQRKP